MFNEKTNEFENISLKAQFEVMDDIEVVEEGYSICNKRKLEIGKKGKIVGMALGIDYIVEIDGERTFVKPNYIKKHNESYTGEELL